MPFSTDFGPVFQAFEGRERDFDWLVTDLDVNFGDPAFPGLHLLDGPRAWLVSGDTLSDLVFAKDPPGQFVWGVLSGLPRGASVDLDRLPVYPYADGGDFWHQRPRLQYPGAKVELVAWDSSLTMLITTEEDLTRRFRAYFPEAEDLARHNAARTRRQRRSAPE